MINPGGRGMPLTAPKLDQLRRHLARAKRLEPVVYAFFAGAVILLVATRFLASTRLQTLYSDTWSNPASFGQQGGFGPWSAPLDDVFIHFDFARSAARGRPFEWSEGNGYSSGGTSLLYPFVLAVGEFGGFRGLELMEWAAIVACVSVFALLLALRRAFVGLPRATSYLVPISLLGVGALSWSFFSGMEIAFFLALWAGAFLVWDGLLRHAVEASPRGVALAAGGLGAWGAALVATRPEALGTVLVFALTTLWALRARGPKLLALSFGLVVTPAALVVLGAAAANYALTGEAAAAGAIAKLELYHPYLTFGQKLDLWLFFLGYQALRVTQEHLESIPAIGWVVWVFALVALYFKETRRYAVLLWGSVLAWAMIVALNGQVRWQNERYVMPALAWLLVAATLGASGLLARGFVRPWSRPRIGLAVATALTLVVFAWQAVPNFRFQAWYFGRASRNIYDQHVRLGRMLRGAPEPSPRVLVGDAGAIPYMSEGPTLDVIGLGGYKGLPFARATRAHVSAAVELIEHLPPAERPTLLAIYPSWWDELPLWFGKRVGEVPARGNVICGAPSKVLYAAHWAALDGSALPFKLAPSEQVTAEFDWADVMSEGACHYERFPALGGRVASKLLPSLENPARDVFDAGRNTPEGTRERFVLRGVLPGRPLRLVLRAAPVADIALPVSVDGRLVGTLNLPRTDGWLEAGIDLPTPAKTQITVELGASGERNLYHAWGVQPR
jgi:hypothetical protein